MEIGLPMLILVIGLSQVSPSYFFSSRSSWYIDYFLNLADYCEIAVFKACETLQRSSNF